MPGLLPTAAALGLSAGSTVISALGARKSGKEARKSRKAAERIASESLALAREVFSNFQPVIKDTTEFFKNTRLDDIVSGKVLAPGTQAALRTFNQASRDSERQLQGDLARRGIANSASGASTLADFTLARSEGRANLAGQGIERSINRRIGLTQLGTQSAQLPIQTGLNVSRQLLGQSAIQRQAAGSQAAGAGASLADLLDRIGNIRKIPEEIED